MTRRTVERIQLGLIAMLLLFVGILAVPMVQHYRATAWKLSAREAVKDPPDGQLRDTRNVVTGMVVRDIQGSVYKMIYTIQGVPSPGSQFHGWIADRAGQSLRYAGAFYPVGDVSSTLVYTTEGLSESIPVLLVSMEENEMPPYPTRIIARGILPAVQPTNVPSLNVPGAL